MKIIMHRLGGGRSKAPFRGVLIIEEHIKEVGSKSVGIRVLLFTLSCGNE